MWRELHPIGRNRHSGGYRRYAWTAADADCRAWFKAQAESRGLTYEPDRNGNQWAWLGDPDAGDAVVTGSHLDSVPDGGAFDGPLGVVSSFAALDELRHRGVEFTKPLAITNFGDEEGARFGLALRGLPPHVRRPHRRAGARTDGRRRTRAFRRRWSGPGTTRRRSAPTTTGSPASARSSNSTWSRAARSTCRVTRSASPARIWPHRPLALRLPRRGQPRGHHPPGGPQGPDAQLRGDGPGRPPRGRLAARAWRRSARSRWSRTASTPSPPSSAAGSTPGPPTRTGALTTRSPRHPKAARADAAAHGSVDLVARPQESFTPVVEFDARPARRAGQRSWAASQEPQVPVLGTRRGPRRGCPGVGSILHRHAAFVRTRTGVSHSPAETAAGDDCLAGVHALADVLEEPGLHVTQPRGTGSGTPGCRRPTSRGRPGGAPTARLTAVRRGSGPPAARRRRPARPHPPRSRQQPLARLPPRLRAPRPGRLRHAFWTWRDACTRRRHGSPRHVPRLRAPWPRRDGAGRHHRVEFHYLHHARAARVRRPNAMGEALIAAAAERASASPPRHAYLSAALADGYRPGRPSCASATARQQAWAERGPALLKPARAACGSARAPLRAGVSDADGYATVADWAADRRASAPRPPLRAAAEHARAAPPAARHGCSTQRLADCGVLGARTTPSTPPTSRTRTSPPRRRGRPALHVPDDRARPRRRHRPGRALCRRRVRRSPRLRQPRRHRPASRRRAR